MNSKSLFLSLLVAGILAFSGCKNSSLKADIAPIADCMCRNIEIMNKLKKADPLDTATVNGLQRKAVALQEEMQKINKAFNEKYKDKAREEQFTKQFSIELRKAMIQCPSLSKEDREQFQKDLDKN
jgi:hypothetical protein